MQRVHIHINSLTVEKQTASLQTGGSGPVPTSPLQRRPHDAVFTQPGIKVRSVNVSQRNSSIFTHCEFEIGQIELIQDNNRK